MLQPALVNIQIQALGIAGLERGGRTRPAVNDVDGGPRCVGWRARCLRGGAGGDDVGVVAEGLVAFEVAEAALARFGPSEGEGRASARPSGTGAYNRSAEGAGSAWIRRAGKRSPHPRIH